MMNQQIHHPDFDIHCLIEAVFGAKELLEANPVHEHQEIDKATEEAFQRATFRLKHAINCVKRVRGQRE